MRILEGLHWLHHGGVRRQDSDQKTSLRFHMSQDKKKPKPSAEPEIMEKIVSLCKQRGFVFQSSEIYGGLKSCYDYGPLGTELKRNIMNEWWRSMVYERENVVGIDA